MPDFKNEFTYKNFLEQGKEGEFDALFDSAVVRVRKGVLGKRYPMYINDEEVFAAEEIVQTSPIDRAVMGRFQKGNRDIAKKAIDAALDAFAQWSEMPYKERAAIFQK